jgi:hypothetical protein
LTSYGRARTTAAKAAVDIEAGVESPAGAATATVTRQIEVRVNKGRPSNRSSNLDSILLNSPFVRTNHSLGVAGEALVEDAESFGDGG